MPPLDLDQLDLPKPPVEPHDDECCGRGCDPCIFDYYERGMQRWETRIRERGLDPAEVRAAFALRGGGEVL
jgi:hypothetical protein